MKINYKEFANISVIKTLRLNFHYLPFRDAIKIPIIVSRKVKIRMLQGEVLFNCPVKTGLVKIGFNTLGLVDYKNNRAIWQNSGIIEFNGRARFGAASKIIIIGGYLSVGDGVSITGNSSIISEKRISIGNTCLISWEVQIMDTDFHRIYDTEGISINNPKEIIIGDHVWIGCRSIILKGSSVPSNSIIAANTTITGSLKQENVIYGGYPVRILKNILTWNN